MDTASSLLPLLAALVTAAVARRLWRQRREPGALPLLLLATASGWWVLAQFLALNLRDPESALLAARLQYVGAAAAPFAWLGFALAWTERTKLLLGPLGLLAAVPLAGAIVALGSPGPGPAGTGPARLPPEAVPGPTVEAALGQALLAGSGYLLVLAATVVLVWHHAQSPRHRHRIVSALVAPSVVAVPHLVSFSALGAGVRIDLTPTGFALASAVLAWSLLREGRLPLAPVARTLIVEEMRDPVLVVDRRGHIVDLNRAARETLGLDVDGDVPVPLGTAWAAGRRRATGERSSPWRVTLPTTAGEERSFETTLTALASGGPYERTVLVLRDVSERERMERELREKGEELRRTNAELERLAHTDVLTGLANRRHFTAVLDREVRRSHRYGGALSLVLLDLDRFKDVNDTYGHPAGDAVLAAVGKAVLAVSRESDVGARLGGEELALVLPETDAGGAWAVAQRLRGRIAALEHPAPDGTRFRVTASLGVAELVTAGGTAGTLHHAADRALYRAKEEGRDRVVVEGGRRAATGREVGGGAGRAGGTDGAMGTEDAAGEAG